MSYESFTNRNNQNFWRNLPRNQQHLLNKNNVLRNHGEELAKQGYDYLENRGQEIAPDERLLFSLFGQIQAKEARHREVLERLAKNLVAQSFGLEPELLEGEIVDDVSFTANVNTEEPQEEAAEGAPEAAPAEAPAPAPEQAPAAAHLSKEQLDKEISKRLSMNALTHGSSFHIMQSMHHAVADAINQIDPELLGLYSQFANVATRLYWSTDHQMVAQFLEMQAGEPPEEGEEAPEAEPQPRGKKPKKVQLPMPAGGAVQINPETMHAEAKANTFPVLLHELTKGAMDLLAEEQMATLPSAEDEATVRHTADDTRWEIPLTQAGQELWRKFLAIAPEGTPLANAVYALAKAKPEMVDRVLRMAIQNPEQAKRLLAQLMPKKAEEEGFLPRKDWTPEQEGGLEESAMRKAQFEQAKAVPDHEFPGEWLVMTAYPSGGREPEVAYWAGQQTGWIKEKGQAMRFKSSKEAQEEIEMILFGEEGAKATATKRTAAEPEPVPVPGSSAESPINVEKPLELKPMKKRPNPPITEEDVEIVPDVPAKIEALAASIVDKTERINAIADQTEAAFAEYKKNVAGIEEQAGLPDLSKKRMQDAEVIASIMGEGAGKVAKITARYQSYLMALHRQVVKTSKGMSEGQKLVELDNILKTVLSVDDYGTIMSLFADAQQHSTKFFATASETLYLWKGKQEKRRREGQRSDTGEEDSLVEMGGHAASAYMDITRALSIMDNMEARLDEAAGMIDSLTVTAKGVRSIKVGDTVKVLVAKLNEYAIPAIQVQKPVIRGKVASRLENGMYVELADAGRTFVRFDSVE